MTPEEDEQEPNRTVRGKDGLFFFFEKPLRTKDWVSALLIKQTRNELNRSEIWT
jgi:hypothetical protein